MRITDTERLDWLMARARRMPDHCHFETRKAIDLFIRFDRLDAKRAIVATRRAKRGI